MTGSCSRGATRARTAARAAQAGWEYVEGLGLEREAPRVAEEAVALLSADPCPAGVTTVVIDAEQMQLQVHESVGHPTELDRVYGTEAAYAGTSFLRAADLGQPALWLGAMNDHRRPDHARRPRHVRVRRRGRAGRPASDRRGRDPDRIPRLPRDVGAHRPRSRRLDARGRMEPDAARPDDEPPPRARRRNARRPARRRRRGRSTWRRTAAGRSTTGASTSSSERRSPGRSARER